MSFKVRARQGGRILGALICLSFFGYGVVNAVLHLLHALGP